MHGVIFNLDLVTNWDFVIKHQGKYIPTASPYRMNCDILYETIDLDYYEGGESDPKLEDAVENLQTRMLAFILGCDDISHIGDCKKHLDDKGLFELSRYEQKCVIGAYRAQYRKEQGDPLWANDLVAFSIIKQQAPTHTHTHTVNNNNGTAAKAEQQLPPGQVIGQVQSNPVKNTTT